MMKIKAFIFIVASLWDLTYKSCLKYSFRGEIWVGTDFETRGSAARLRFSLLGPLRREAPYKRKQVGLLRRQGCSNKVLYKHSYPTLIEEEGPVFLLLQLWKKIRETKRFLDDEWLTSFLRRCVESTEKVLRASFTITTFLPLSSSLVIIPEQQYKHSDIEGQKSHDCLLEQALLYSMHLALYPKVEQHCQTNSGMKKMYDTPVATL